MLAARQYVQDDVVNAELKKLLSLTEYLHCRWDDIMEEPEARTRWMCKSIMEMRNEAERDAEIQAEAQKFKGAATMG